MDIIDALSIVLIIIALIILFRSSYSVYQVMTDTPGSRIGIDTLFGFPASGGLGALGITSLTRGGLVEPTIAKPAPAPETVAAGTDPSAMPEWVLPVLLGIAAVISVVVGTKVARRALKKRRIARRTQHRRAELWRDAVARMEQVQALQASYEGVPMGEITTEQAWDRAFSMPEFSSVHRPEHQAMIKNLRAANTMCQSLRVPGSDTTGTITLEGTDDQLAAFHAAITEYEIAVQTNASSARALGTSELSDQLQGLISQSRAILSQIGEGSVLPEDTMAHLLEKLNRNVAQINQLHGSEMIRPAMVRAIGTELTRRRAITV